MSNDVFISYSHRDLAFVSQLHQELKQRGVSVWFDQTGIKAGDQRREKIAKSIMECKLFLLVLSPDSLNSSNVRKEIYLAESNEKKIVPLRWRESNLPVSAQYQLDGIQYFKFDEEASKEKFDKLTDVVKRLIAGASMAEAASDKKSAESLPVPALPKEAPALPPSSGRRKLSGGRKLGGAKPKLNAVAIGGMVISGVITTADLSIEDQDFVNGELKWLFAAADWMIQIQSGKADIDQKLSVPIPNDAKRQEEANNKLFPAYNSRRLVTSLGNMLKNINQHLKNLDLLLDREVSMGEEAKRNVNLQNQIREGRLDIVKILRQIAELIRQSYGIKITAPEQLQEFLEEA